MDQYHNVHQVDTSFANSWDDGLHEVSITEMDVEIGSSRKFKFDNHCEGRL